MIPRADQMAQFVAGAGWQGAETQPLAGDASARRYFRLRLGLRRAIVMDNPPGGVDDPAQFVAIAQHLLQLGLSPPQILATDLHLGLLLLEDLGDDVLAKVAAHAPQREGALYRSAADVLAHIQRHAPPPNLNNLTAAEWADAAMLAPAHYSAAVTGAQVDAGALQSSLHDCLGRWADGPRVMILRDYHAENLMVLPDRKGLGQIGLLDFQLAQMGQPVYDLVSLLQDARRDVLQDTQTAVLRHWCDITGQTQADVSVAYAAVGVQRALRIMGIFARLCIQQGKAGYLDYLPRVWGHLQQNLAHPKLADLATVCAQTVPPPSKAALDALRSKCKTQP